MADLPPASRTPQEFATLATYFVGRDAESAEGELPSAQSIEELRRELAALREELARRSHQ